MNEMYIMGLSIHSIGGVGLLVVVFLNIVILFRIKDLSYYKRMMSVFLMPLTAMVLGGMIFTGVIMMAAKHLDFTIPNIAMIIISIILIFFEVKRAKTLKYINPSKDGALEAYKGFAQKLLYVEFVSITLISLWMWMI
jgi:hypothetical protein